MVYIHEACFLLRRYGHDRWGGYCSERGYYVCVDLMCKIAWVLVLWMDEWTEYRYRMKRMGCEMNRIPLLTYIAWTWTDDLVKKL